MNIEVSEEDNINQHRMRLDLDSMD